MGVLFINNDISIKWLQRIHRVIERVRFTGAFLQKCKLYKRKAFEHFTSGNFQNRKVNFIITKRNEKVLVFGK